MEKAIECGKLTTKGEEECKKNTSCEWNLDVCERKTPKITQETPDTKSTKTTQQKTEKVTINLRVTDETGKANLTGTLECKYKGTMGIQQTKTAKTNNNGQLKLEGIPADAICSVSANHCTTNSDKTANMLSKMTYAQLKCDKDIKNCVNKTDYEWRKDACTLTSEAVEERLREPFLYN